MLEIYDAQRLANSVTGEIGDALEQGNIVKFPSCPIELPTHDELDALRKHLPQQLKRKNVSYHPEADRVTGLDDDSPVAELAHRVLSNHRTRVTEFLETVMPKLTKNMRVGTSSFRPLEEQGRNLKPHASNELVHIDAGAYGATNGDRILRFFVNVNPHKDRVWSSKGAFPQLFEKYGREAGLYEGLSPALERGVLGRLRSSILNGIAGIGLPLAPMLDSSPYDRVMRKFHNYMKDTPEFQVPDQDYRTFSFEPFSAWMVFTDMLSHASVSGQHALIYTALIPLENCQIQELAPFNILRAAA